MYEIDFGLFLGCYFVDSKKIYISYEFYFLFFKMSRSIGSLFFFFCVVYALEINIF